MAVEGVLAVDRRRRAPAVSLARTSEPPCFSVIPMPARAPVFSRDRAQPGVVGRGRPAWASTPWRSRRRRAGPGWRRTSSRSGSRGPARSGHAKKPAARRTCACGSSDSHGAACRPWPTAALHQPVPGGVEAHLVDPVAVAVERHQLGVELVGEHARARGPRPTRPRRPSAARSATTSAEACRVTASTSAASRGDGVVARPAGGPGCGLPGCRRDRGHGLTVVAMAAESSPRPRARTLSWETVRSALWRLIVSTVGTCMRNRVTGLAAEAAFFAVLSLPPLIFALAGSIGYVFAQFSDSQIDEVRDTVLDLAGQALTPQTVDSIIRPTLNEVLSGGGRYDVVSIGFILALWSGSRALNVFVDTITIMYGLGGHRGHRAHPGAVVPALRARHDHRRRSPSRWSSPARPWSRKWLPDRFGVPQPALLADRAGAGHLLPGDALPRVGAGADALALQPAGRRVHDVLLGVRLRAAAARAGRHGARARPRSTARSPPRSRCCCGSTCSPSRC